MQGAGLQVRCAGLRHRVRLLRPGRGLGRGRGRARGRSCGPRARRGAPGLRAAAGRGEGAPGRTECFMSYQSFFHAVRSFWRIRAVGTREAWPDARVISNARMQDCKRPAGPVGTTASFSPGLPPLRCKVGLLQVQGRGHGTVIWCDSQGEKVARVAGPLRERESCQNSSKPFGSEDTFSSDLPV